MLGFGKQSRAGHSYARVLGEHRKDEMLFCSVLIMVRYSTGGF